VLKRSSRAGLGPCQGGACLPHVRAWIAARTGEVPEPFTARPATRQITIAEAAADTHIDAFRRTPLHDEHLALGGRMDRFGGWWRPWHYGDVVSEYWAVREGVSIGDVSTLGKLVVSGPDVVEFLERLYPCRVADIKPGRSRYALLLNERGHVMDDGMLVRESETRFVLSFTSGGAANAEMWLRDWIEAWGLRVHVLDRTMSLAAINVTGPRPGAARPCRAIADPAVPRPRHADVAGVLLRHAPVVHRRGGLRAPAVDRSVELWRALLDLGHDLGIRPHGLQALFGLRLEKGHVIVGMDRVGPTAGSGWTGRSDGSRGSSAGSSSGPRRADLRRWVGCDGRGPTEGADLVGGEIVRTSRAAGSPLMGRAVMLGCCGGHRSQTGVESAARRSSADRSTTGEYRARAWRSGTRGRRSAALGRGWRGPIWSAPRG
jgi:sarcosine oxidase subunit alpha